MEDYYLHLRSATGKLYYAGEVFLIDPFNRSSDINRRNFKRCYLRNGNAYSFRSLGSIS